MPDTKSRRTLIRIEPSLHEECKARAALERRSLAALIRLALRDYLDRAKERDLA